MLNVKWLNVRCAHEVHKGNVKVKWQSRMPKIEPRQTVSVDRLNAQGVAVKSVTDPDHMHHEKLVRRALSNVLKGMENGFWKSTAPFWRSPRMKNTHVHVCIEGDGDGLFLFISNSYTVHLMLFWAIRVANFQI